MKKNRLWLVVPLVIMAVALFRLGVAVQVAYLWNGGIEQRVEKAIEEHAKSH